MRRLRRLLVILFLILLLLPVLIFAGALAWLQTATGQQQLVELIASATASGDTQVSIGRIEGTIPSDFFLHDVELADHHGRWLQADSIHLAWSPLALLSRTVKIELLRVDKVTLLRPPVSSTPAQASSGPPSLPRLPVDLDIQSVSVAQISLPAELAGTAMTLAIDAQASAKRGGDLTAKVAVHRTDDPTGREDVALDLAYLQASDHLKLDLNVTEPQGGLVTKALGLSGPHQLVIAAQGDAPLADWAGTANIRLDDQALLDLTAKIRGTPTEHQIELSLHSDPAMLVPANLQALIAGGIDLIGTATISAGTDAPQITLTALKATTGAAEVNAHGLIDPVGRMSDLSFRLTSSSSVAFATLVPQLSWKNVTIDGEITGPLTLPHINLTSDIQGIAYADNIVDQMHLALTARSGASAAAPIAVTLKLDADGLVPAQEKLPPLRHGPISLLVDASLTRAGDIDAKSIILTGDIATLDATAQATGWGQQSAQAQASLKANDLSIFSSLAGMKLKGALQLDLDASKASDDTHLALTANLQDFATGQAQLDRLLGGKPSLKLTADQAADQTIILRDAELTGQAVSVTAAGHANLSHADADHATAGDIALQVTAALPNLTAIDPTLNGGARLEATLTGTMAKPDLAARITAEKIAAATIVARNLAIDLQVPDLLAATTATLRGKSSINGLPMTLAGDIKLPAAASDKIGDKTIQIDKLQAQLGRSTLGGQVRLTGSLAAGRLTLTVPDLAELTPLTGAAAPGTTVQGALTIDTTLATPNGKQSIDTLVNGKALAYGTDAKIAGLTLQAKILDALGTPNIAARLEAAGIAAAQQTIATAQVTANGTLGQLAVTLDAKGPQLQADVAAGISKTAKAETVTLQKADLQGYGQRISLAHPAVVTHDATSLRIDSLVLRNGSGEIAVNGILAPGGNQLAVQIHHLSLAVLTAVMPSPRIDGEINGTVSLSGSNRAPQAAIALSFDHVASKDLSIPPTDATVNVTWQDARLAAVSEIKLASQDQPLRITAGLPLPADPATGLPQPDMSAELTAALTGKVDLALANGILLDSVSRVTGRADIDLKLAGPLQKPQASGQVAVVNGSYGNLRTGTRLREIQATVLANGLRFELQSFSAKTPGNGSLGGTGYVDLTTKRDVAIHITAKNAQLLNNTLASAVADADLSVATVDEGNLQMTGKIKIDEAEIRIPDHFAGSVQEIEVTEQNGGAKTNAPTSPDDAPRTKAAAPLRIALDLTIDAPQQVAVRGRGLDAELGGKLHVGGEASQPAITGQLKLRRGKFDLVGRSLNFDHGIIAFDGGTPIDPTLDFVAKSKADSYDIIVTVSGTASKPVLALTSTPALPQDEALARLLFDRSAGSLSALQALQLAQAAATLAGVNAGPGILDRVRQATGLDRLSIDAGDDAGSKTAATGPSLSAGRYVAPGVYLGVKQGTKTSSSAATVEIDVTPHVKVETDIGAADSSKAGVNMQWDY